MERFISTTLDFLKSDTSLLDRSMFSQLCLHILHLGLRRILPGVTTRDVIGYGFDTQVTSDSLTLTLDLEFRIFFT